MADTKKKKAAPKTKKSKSEQPKSKAKRSRKVKPEPEVPFADPTSAADEDIKVTRVDKQMRKPEAPVGLGLYIRAMPNNRTKILRRAKQMADHGIKWAAVGACWQDRDRHTKRPTIRVMNPAERVHMIVDALLQYGIEPHLWGYPWRGREQQFVEIMGAASTPDVKGWLLDPELGMKIDRHDPDHDTMDEVLAATKALFWACVEYNPYMLIGFTSYGFVKGHPTFPWHGFAKEGGFDPLNECDYGSPQLYDQPPADIRRGLEQYREIGTDIIVPSYGTYRFSRNADGDRTYPRMNYVQLKSHLQAFVNLKDEFNIRGMIGWSEMQVSSDAWRAIAEFAPLFG